MNNTKTTKRALLSSALATFICIAMLIGTTFAWFTDSASTAVNKIQAGTLDVALEMKDDNGNWVNAEGETLSWKKAATAPVGEQVLWEPGCTYELPELRIVNKGKLALKYKIAITGINGDAELNRVIDWTINGDPINLVEKHLAANTPDTAFVIKGHMQESAGNEYQGLSIDGIGITVVATQLASEFDSFNNVYDQNAEYNKKSITLMGANENTLALENGKTYTVGNATVQVAENGDISYTNSGNAQTVTIYTDGGTLTVNAPNDTVHHYGEANFVNITAIAGNSFHEFGKVDVLSIEKGRVVIEKGDNVILTQVKSEEAIVSVPNNKVLKTTLQKADGITEIQLQKGNDTPITIKEAENWAKDEVPNELKNVIGVVPTQANDNYVAKIEKKFYTSLSEALDNAQSGDTMTLIKDVELNSVFLIDKSIIIDGQGHNIYNTANRVIRVTQQNLNIKLYNMGIISKCTDSNDVRGISFDNISSNSSLLLDGCTVSASFYAINIVAGPENLNITIKNGTVAAGWAAINSYANNSTFTIENSVLRGLNDKGENSWNNFATIVFDGNGLWNETNIGKYGSNNTMNISDSTIYASSNSSNNQAWFAIQYGALNNRITVDSATKIIDSNNEDQTDNHVEIPFVGYKNGKYSKSYDHHSELTIGTTTQKMCYHGEIDDDALVSGGTHTPFEGCTAE